MNIGASKVIGDAINRESKERRSYSSSPSNVGPQLNVIGVVREDVLRCGEQMVDGMVCSYGFEDDFMNQGNKIISYRSLSRIKETTWRKENMTLILTIRK